MPKILPESLARQIKWKHVSNEIKDQSNFWLIIVIGYISMQSQSIQKEIS